MPPFTLADWLRNRLRERGLSQRQLAARTGSAIVIRGPLAARVASHGRVIPCRVRLRGVLQGYSPTRLVAQAVNVVALLTVGAPLIQAVTISGKRRSGLHQAAFPTGLRAHRIARVVRATTVRLVAAGLTPVAQAILPGGVHVELTRELLLTALGAAFRQHRTLHRFEIRQPRYAGDLCPGAHPQAYL